MTKKKICIVGREGTTGLRIDERLSQRDDIEVLPIPEDKRKDLATIKEVASQADLVFLCLPDQAAKDVVEVLQDLSCKVIDASTAHRTNPDWAYGFPELGPDYRETIAQCRFIANPGCHASGAIAILAPLIKKGLVPADYPLTVLSLTGYSGGGKKMIAQYQAMDTGSDLCAPRQYGLGQSHKHMPEVQAFTGLVEPPVFLPVVDDYYAGMETSIGFHLSHLKGISPQDIWQAFQDYYAGSKIIKVAPFNLEEINGLFLGANQAAGLDTMTLYVSGNQDRVLVHAIFDNLGKGASGAAVQCMNIALGLAEETGLVI